MLPSHGYLYSAQPEGDLMDGRWNLSFNYTATRDMNVVVAGLAASMLKNVSNSAVIAER